MTVDSIAMWLLKIAPMVLGLVLLIQGARALILALISKRWPKVEGEIVASQVAEIPLRGAGEIIHASSGYIPQIEYRFPLDGQTLHGHRIALGEKLTGAPYRSAKARADSYRPGSKVTVFYHPRKPSIAALKLGSPAPSFVSLLAGLALISLGILISWACHVYSL